MGNYFTAEYFSIKQDREIINAGGFFCHACLASKPATEASPDPRYCQVCYDFLTKEAEMLPENKRPKWIPKPQRALKACEKQYHIPQVGDGIMSTLESKKDDGKRGRKKLTLPVETILEMSKQGLGSKAIATLLRTEQGVDVSYKTIQRTLADEREFDKHGERSNGE